MSTNEVLYAPNPSGQRGIWAHSQNVETDLLKRFVVQVHRPGGFGWTAMLSFDLREDALIEVLDGYFTGRYGKGATIRVWDDRKNEVA